MISFTLSFIKSYSVYLKEGIKTWFYSVDFVEKECAVRLGMISML